MTATDPPYNTGNDFVYEDDFAQNAEEYIATSGQYDEEGNRLVQNTERNGRFHTDWLNMMYPRLKLAKDLLTDDGVIFISIDENEVENLKKVGNEVFGEKNFVGSVIWERAFAPKNDAKYFSDSHDYIVVYAKSIIDFKIGKLPRTEEANARYKNPDNDPRGAWASDNLTVKTYSADYDYEITTPSGKIIRPTDGRCWFTNKRRMQALIDDGRVWFGESGDNMPRLKRFLSDVQQGMVPTTIWKYDEVGHNQEGRQELKKLFDDKGYFDGPKPVRLLHRILQIANTKLDDIILDFFSGSATTAHAVMQLNAEDGGNRKFIMVQLPEKTDEKSEAYKAGYKNICEIGKERIRRAGKKILEENKDKPGVENLDIGFRVLKCDSGNMKDVYYSPSDYEPSLFSSLTDNIKEDRSPEDLLFQVMLDLGVLLSSKIEETTIAGKKVFSVADGYLIACFDENLTDETIKAIAQKKPYYFVMRDGGYASDSVATNFDQIFAAYSPSTIKKVL
jgi:adenine-specific DNA-methyltransferase